MTTQRSTLDADLRPTHPVFLKAKMAGLSMATEVRVAAEYLAEAMRDIHGGKWRVQIDHGCRLIVITEIISDHPINPKREGA